MSTADVARALLVLPDDTRCAVTIGTGDICLGELRDAFSTPREDRLFTTGEAHKEFGFSSNQWRRWASLGLVEGAFQDGPGGRWRLPRTGCKARIANERTSRTARRRGGNGPWKEK